MTQNDRTNSFVSLPRKIGGRKQQEEQSRTKRTHTHARTHTHTNPTTAGAGSALHNNVSLWVLAAGLPLHLTLCAGASSPETEATASSVPPCFRGSVPKLALPASFPWRCHARGGSQPARRPAAGTAWRSCYCCQRLETRGDDRANANNNTDSSHHHVVLHATRSTMCRSRAASRTRPSSRLTLPRTRACRRETSQQANKH